MSLNESRHIIFSIAIVFICVICGSSSAEVPRLNVLLLVADDLRGDVVGARTPVLDELARQGTVLTRATCAYPLCFPSRAELLTGCSSFRTRVGIDATALDRGFAVWPQAMQRGGYQTFHIGKWHIAGRPSQRGYDAAPALFAGGPKPSIPQRDHRGREVTGYVGWQFQTDDGQRFPERGVGLTPDISQTFADAAIEVIRQPRDQPFFLHVDFTAPHDPRLYPTRYEKRFDPARITLPRNYLSQHPFDHGNLRGRDEILLPIPRPEEEVRAELAAYYAVVSHMDEQIGRILRALDDTHQTANTLVIFTSDHGLALGSHGLMGKQNMYDHTIRVPLFVRGPGVRAGSKCSALCYLRDLYPTVSELCGLEAPTMIDGQSIAGLLRGEDNAHAPFVIGYFQNFQRMIRTDRWKLIWYPHLDKEQLFDLDQDPDEMHDVAETRANTAVRDDLRTTLRRWLAEHGDPVMEK